MCLHQTLLSVVLSNYEYFALKLDEPLHNGHLVERGEWRGGGVLLGIFGGVVPPTSPNTDPISDQKMSFPIPVFRSGLKNPYPFSDLTLYMIKHSICISAEWKST